VKLRVEGIRLEASHAAYDWEQKLGTVLDVSVEAVYRERPKSDRLSQAIGVEDIVNAVYRISNKKTYRILEALAGDILDSIWKAHRAHLAELVVRVRKVRPKSERRITGYEVEVSRP
jgi:dihydroneopterin aldolase